MHHFQVQIRHCATTESMNYVRNIFRYVDKARIKLKKSFLPLPHPFLLALDFVIANQVYRDIQTSGEGRDIMFSKNKVVSTEH